MSQFRNKKMGIMQLEDRRVPAVFGVAGLADGAFAGTLRWAINQANALAGPDTVDCTKVAGVINLTLGELPITDSLTILGPGASLLTISGGGLSRIFNTQKAPAGAPITFSGLTMTSGKSASFGGAIAGDDEAITLRSCVIVGNSAATRGGGISLQKGGSLVATDSRFLGNVAVTLGGGIDVGGGTGAKTTLHRCTVANNYAAKGGGIHAENYLFVQDSTISGNKVTGSGGGVLVLGTGTSANSVATVRNSTVSLNSCPGIGGGVALENFNGSFDVYNSTFTQNSANTKGGAIGLISGGGRIYLESSILQNDTSPFGPEISAGEVLYRRSSLFNPAGIVALVNLGFNLPFFTDCKLGLLGNNGGPTQTHRLNLGSPAINAGSNLLAFAFDQRGAGFNRTIGGGTDMGAYERPLILIPPVVAGFTVNTGAAQRSMITSLRVTFSEAVEFPHGPAAAVKLEWTHPNGTELIPLDISVEPGSAEYIVHWKLITSLPVDPTALPDGTFRLMIAGDGTVAPVNADGLALDGDGDGMPGGTYETGFHRLFGDADGDRDVDAADYHAFRQSFGSSSAVFDADGDGDVDTSDFGQIRQRFGSSI